MNRSIVLLSVAVLSLVAVVLGDAASKPAGETASKPTTRPYLSDGMNETVTLTRGDIECLKLSAVFSTIQPTYEGTWKTKAFAVRLGDSGIEIAVTVSQTGKAAPKPKGMSQNSLVAMVCTNVYDSLNRASADLFKGCPAIVTLTWDDRPNGFAQKQVTVWKRTADGKGTSVSNPIPATD